MALCRDTTELITAYREGRGLSRPRRLLLRFHLAVCPYCARYARQVDATVTALKALEPRASPTPEMGSLLEELRKRKG